MNQRLAAAVIGTVALLLTSSSLAAGDQPSDQRLYNNGLIGYANGNCVTVARYWYAYLLRNPADLTASRRNRIDQVINGCEQAPTRYAYNIAVFELVRPTRQQECDTYGELAVAQYEAAQAANCGLSGTRWSPNKEYHSRWCMTVKAQQDYAERSARDEALKQCLATKP